ncbi:MAG: diaminobutyrate acetyltransferase [Sandaracinaceae bacterium]|nr:diaminobutyrate acetyltransferase [Sandaracinaceae bacterium]
MKREDGPTVSALVRETGILDPNSTYAYVLLGDRFGQHGLVAEEDGKLIGFVSGFLDPREPSTLFLWQIGLRAEARGRGLGKKLLNAFISLPANRRARALETTVAIDNLPSRRLFEAFSRDHGASIEAIGAYGSELLDGNSEEVIFRIAPLPSHTSG